MPATLIQDIVVTFTALGCAGYVLARVAGVVRPEQTGGCERCPSSAHRSTTSDTSGTHPLIVVRPSRR